MKTDTKTVLLHGEELQVEFTYWAGCRGARDSFNGRPGAGIQLEPDDEAGLEVNSVVNAYGKDVTAETSEDDFERITELLNEIEQEEPDYSDDYEYSRGNR